MNKMLSFYHVYLFFLLFTMKLISSDEITIKSVLSNHEKTYNEIRGHILPTIRRMSRKMQSIIIKTTEQHKKMLEFKNVIDQSCLSSSLIFNMTILSRNLTQIMRKDVPSIEDQLQHILPQMEQIQKQIDEMMPSVKEQQQGTLLYTEQVQRLQTFTNIYQKWNDQLLQIHRQLMQILDDILHPGLDSIEKYNTCLSTTGQLLIDYGIDQALELIDEDNDDQLFPLDNLSPFYNHTDL